MSYWIYIIQSQKNGRLYIGQTRNVDDRLNRHNKRESLSTKSGAPWRLVHIEEFKNRSEAIKRERHLKSLKNKDYLQKLINDAGWRSSISPGS